MKYKKFTNPPLVEAIFELRWFLKEIGQDIKIDPHYKVLVGSLYSNLKDIYPFHEQLISASMPDEMACYVVQHRFRTGKDQWPLVQIGPGIVTLNSTTEYRWIDFKDRLSKLLDNLLQVYPDIQNFDVSNILMRYINAMPFDYNAASVFDYLSKNMKININLNQELFKNTEVVTLPVGFDIKCAFPASKPQGNIHLRLTRGKKDNSDALIFEIIFKTLSKYVPKQNHDILDWVYQAHDVIEDWFLKLIEGELERSFK